MFNAKKVESYSNGSGYSNGSTDLDGSASNGTSRVSSYDRNRSSGHALVDECLVVRGDLESDGDILIKGKVYGNVKCKMLIIDVDASVEGGIEAEEVIIRGRSKGMVYARRVCLEKSAFVESEICHETFAAEEGARIMGTLIYSENPMSSAAEPVKVTRPIMAVASARVADEDEAMSA